MGLVLVKVIIFGGFVFGVMSLWFGFVVVVSEVVDFFGWDDNLIILVFSGFGIWGFFKVFG